MPFFFSSSEPVSVFSCCCSLLEDEAAVDDAVPVSVFSAGLLPQAESDAASRAVHANTISVFFM